MKRLLVFLLSITLFLAFSSSSAFALPKVTSLFSADGTSQLAEDDNVEWLEYDANNDGLLDIGDTLRGVFRITTFDDINIAGGTAQVSTGLSGVFEAQVTSKTARNTTDPITGSNLYDFTFGPAGYSTGLFQNEGQSMIALYETNSPLFDFDDDPGNIRTRQELIDDATDGTLLYEFGFTYSGNSEYWFSNNISENPGDGAFYGDEVSLGNFNVALSVTYNDFLPVLTNRPAVFAPLFGGSGFSDITGSGSIEGVQGMNTSAQLSSDIQFRIATVPEPTTLLLFGTGLLGLAFFGRKRFMAKKQ